MTESERMGVSVTHRRYVSLNEVRHTGSMVDPAFVMSMFSDACIELCVRTDGDEGKLVSYHEVDLLSPVYPGDVVEASACITRVGSTSRQIYLQAKVVCRSDRFNDDRPLKGNERASHVLEEPLVVVRARATVVVTT